MNRHEFLKTMAAGAASLLIPRWTWGDEPSEAKTFTYKTAAGCVGSGSDGRFAPSCRLVVERQAVVPLPANAGPFSECRARRMSFAPNLPLERRG